MAALKCSVGIQRKSDSGFQPLRRGKMPRPLFEAEPRNLADIVSRGPDLWPGQALCPSISASIFRTEPALPGNQISSKKDTLRFIFAQFFPLFRPLAQLFSGSTPSHRHIYFRR